MSKKYAAVLGENQWQQLRALVLFGRLPPEKQVLHDVTDRKGLYAALRDVTEVTDWLSAPTHNGEWAYRPKGRKVAKSVVFVAGVTQSKTSISTGYVQADLAGELEGKPVAKLNGTWKRVIIP